MAKLSDSQAVVLGAACGRPDRSIYPLTTKLPGAAAAKLLGSLLKKGYIEELQAKPKDTTWREDKKKGRLTLRATQAAFEALGMDLPPSQSAGADAAPRTASPQPAKARGRNKQQADKAKPDALSRTRPNSKQAQLIEMLKSPKGATIEEIVKKFEWQAHTVRGAIAGALKKKLGLDVQSEKIEGRGRVYRLC